METVNWLCKCVMMNCMSRMIKVVVTSNASMINDWISAHAQPKCAIGLDIEWKPYGSNRTAIVQIASSSSILIAQIFHYKELPSNLFNVLQDTQVTKIGVGITEDLGKLDDDFQTNCRVCSFFDRVRLNLNYLRRRDIVISQKQRRDFTIIYPNMD